MKKKKTASAIGYETGDIAPVLLAAGRGHKAEQIISIAEEAGIAVVEDAALAALLETSAKPGDYIPHWCWEAAAKVLAFVMEQENKGKRGY
ncbi:MAG: EscU/YscU/HrcU family type III secretion system export apparatus switch protein [Treponema sp.]|nr:EscU/YscU/HrcU family type III secretion system export apparatus switch protein [Treponema sp.]